MILNPEQIAELKEVSKPLMKWINENCHPHVVVMVEPTRVEFLAASVSFNNDEFVKD